jgi:transposase
MEAYSMDLRKRVLAACDASKGTKEVARLFDVSEAWVRRLKQRRREWGRIEPLPRNSGRKPVLDEAGRERLAALVRRKPDATLEELRAGLPIRISLSALWATLKQLELSFKKSPCTRPSRTGRTSNSNAKPGTKR